MGVHYHLRVHDGAHKVSNHSSACRRCPCASSKLTLPIRSPHARDFSTNATSYSGGFASAGHILGVSKEGWTVGNAAVSVPLLFKQSVALRTAAEPADCPPPSPSSLSSFCS